MPSSYIINPPMVSTSGLDFTATWGDVIDTDTGVAISSSISVNYALYIKTATGPTALLTSGLNTPTYSTADSGDVSGGYAPGSYFLQVEATFDANSGGGGGMMGGGL